MDNHRMPFVPDEVMRSQRVEIYLQDLKERLSQLRHQHQEIIENSVSIIQEIGEVTSNLSFIESNHNTRIKQLIREFECGPTQNAMKSTQFPNADENHRVDVKKILENFEKLNDSHVLRESIILFKRAKDSLDKIDTFFVELTNDKKREQHCSKPANDLKCKISSPSKPCGIAGSSKRTSPFASCCSSFISMNDFYSTEDVKVAVDNKNPATSNISDMGYQGDVDESEYDMLANKKKKSKNPVIET